MALKIDFNNVFHPYLQKERLGEADIDGYKEKFTSALISLREKKEKGELGFFHLPYLPEEEIAEIEKTAREVREKFKYFVVLGIGGSALGPLAVHTALNNLRYNELSEELRGGPKFYVEDNIDPERMASLLKVIEPEKTVFNVITKSGATAETLSQLLIVTEVLKKKVGKRFTEHLIFTTDPEKGSLRALARELGVKTFAIPPNVGGRFSELTPVGLLPAAVTGINIRELLAGAREMAERCERENLWENPAGLAAAIHVLLLERGKNMAVMMPYADSLKYMADWYAQLLGESIGKRLNRRGEEVFVGQTPVKALGVTDQHSQVQLYTEGPFDKLLIFLEVERYRNRVVIPPDFPQYAELKFLGGHTLNELIIAEKKATEFALLKARRPNYTVIFPEVNPYTVGELLYFLEAKIAFMGEYLDINAFDQPGVEEGKKATYALLGREGFEEKRQEVLKVKKEPRFILE
ncbi:glucose-6-phosphate isomerase [Carboxydothermus ferrireducens]|uniref:Glucose-6-phosphate isomerase n=1 Tax=Carboxydothermus ferrireducens DSM 11255 TaxID=1119529 RepID=A0ABX2RC22_9THEO|nr:glucose-6-phosphate isomerase [Carboxydothermus ferrireducens]NYE57353.1 glucose-6-phosphate isomerase [Carboxydothermus ferrireducens DSM 11255]